MTLGCWVTAQPDPSSPGVWHLNAGTFQEQTIVSHLICKLKEIGNELNFLQTLRRFTKSPISKSTVLFA